jgi:hypothetical protein
MILSTELGKDPLLRQEMRDTFKEHAVVSVLPTERGKLKIDEHHAYYVRSIFVYMEETLHITSSGRISNTSTIKS